jgi:ribosomal protein S27E
MSSATCSGSAEQPANNSKDNSAEPLPGPPALPHRAKLQGAVAGNWFAWPDVCTAKNGWSIPTEKFQVQEIVGQYLVKLKDCPGRDCNRLKMQRFCKHCQLPEQAQQCMCDKAPRPVKCEVCGRTMEPTLSEAPVNALLHPKGQVRIYGPLKSLVNDEGNVLVKFGTQKQSEEAEEKECYEGPILTPRTPSTPPSPSPPRKQRKLCHSSELAHAVLQLS